MMCFPSDFSHNAFFPEAQQGSMEQKHQYLASVFVFQTDLGRSIWSRESNQAVWAGAPGSCLLWISSRSSGFPLSCHFQEQQVAHRSCFPCLTVLSKRDGRTDPKKTAESWESFSLPCAGCGGDHGHCPGSVEMTPPAASAGRERQFLLKNPHEALKNPTKLVAMPCLTDVVLPLAPDLLSASAEFVTCQVTRPRNPDASLHWWPELLQAETHIFLYFLPFPWTTGATDVPAPCHKTPKP